MNKIKTFSIDNNISDEFDKLAKELNLNKSSFIEGKIKDFILERREIETKKNVGERQYRIVEKIFTDRTEYHPEFKDPRIDEWISIYLHFKFHYYSGALTETPPGPNSDQYKSGVSKKSAEYDIEYVKKLSEPHELIKENILPR
jgi:hypothetical protein